MRALPVAVRGAILKMLRFIVESYPAATKALETDFIVGYLRMIDGEKDPRLLMDALSFFPDLCQKYFPNTHPSFAEEMFEIAACYFPISFNPKSGDPKAITKQDLINALKSAFTASPFFATFSIPFLLDKASSSPSSTVAESMEWIQYCIGNSPTSIFHGEEGILLLRTLATTLCAQVLESKENAADSLSCIIGVTEGISSDKEVLSRWIEMIFKHSLGIVPPSGTFGNPKNNNARSIKNGQNRSIIIALASATLESFDIVQREVLPVALNTFVLDEDWIVTVTSMLRCAARLNAVGTLKSLQIVPWEQEGKVPMGTDGVTACIDYITRGLKIERKSTKSIQLAKAAVVGVPIILDFIRNSETRNSGISGETVSEEDLKRWKQHANELMYLVSKETISGNLGNEGVSALGNLWEQRHADITPHFQEFLKTNSGNELKEGLSILLNLAKSTPAAVDSIVQLIVPLLASKPDDSGLVLSVLAQSIANTETTSLGVEVITELLRISPQLSFETAISVQNIVSRVTAATSVENQERIFQEIVLPMFVKKDFSLVGSHNKSLDLILHNIVRSLSPKVNFQEFEKLVSNSLGDIEIPELSLAACQTLGNLVNKCQEEDLEKSYDLISSQVAKMTASPEILQSVLWICKGLVMRGHPKGTEIVKTIASNLKPTSDVQLEIQVENLARGFGFFLSDSPQLGSETNAIIRGFYKQKLFIQIFPTLADSQLEFNLMAVASMLANVPTAILINDIDRIFPLMRDSLHLNSLEELTLTSLQILPKLFESVPKLQKNSLEIIPKLLTLVESPKMNIREGSLKFLRIFVHMEDVDVKSLQSEVVKKLHPCLDDKKRNVRREAVKTRNEWLSL
eukprot:TRINITY_DN2815_c4_g1_i2.p1 TRINITY_DN2815_c4_g1~~TRINITY_DN2815_c4_g1_i2.p1  ORF type:complete len:858 (-),score=315.18 TRINITY_DN2815_c4_g1_i2:271-2844(-)